MKFKIKHEISGRVRVHLYQNKMTCKEAERLEYYLESLLNVTEVKVYERTCDAVIYYTGERKKLLQFISEFQYENAAISDDATQSYGREINARYQEKLLHKIIFRVVLKFFIPTPLRGIYVFIRALHYIKKGLKSLIKRKIEVAVLDAVAIGVSLLRGDMSTAGSIMFLLSVGDILEEWTHKKSVGDLAKSMSLNVNKVWTLRDEQEVLVDSNQIAPSDIIIVHMSNVIPFDGVIQSGTATVNQSSLTGEGIPVKKERGSYVYAGTVVEEGELFIIVKEVKGSTRFEKIVSMIEESEKLKSGLESKAEHLADRLVVHTLLGTCLVGLLTGNITKALSVLMVDFSCALKLAMPITVLSAIREGSNHRITVKGGKYMEAVADATTIVFDKTGTLTKAKPTVKDVIMFDEGSPMEMLRIAACLEEHFPHSMAKAVVKAAKERGLEHEEMHSKVEYIVAHGISSRIEDKKVVIGSHHFIFEDEQCRVYEIYRNQLETLPKEYTHLYLAIDQKFVAVILIEDPLREEAKEVILSLKSLGIKKVVLMTGDNERTAKAIAKSVTADEYYSEVLPEDKARFIEQERAAGNVVIMVGDGINDSPALSVANVGIAISDGAEIAREVADITISADDLWEIVKLKKLSDGLMKRIQGNYRQIITINTGLILLGISGMIQPTTSAFLHNTSTLGISLLSMRKILK